MGLLKINVRGYQIETVRYNGTVFGFKVHGRAFFPGKGTKNYIELGEFEYFMDAALMVAKQLSHGDEKKDRILANLLAEIYAEGDDFK